MAKAVRAAWVEGHDWRKELGRFLLNYRTTQHLSTGVASAELLHRRVIRSTIPTRLHRFKNNLTKDIITTKMKSKQYSDIKRHAQESTIKEGDLVLVKQRVKNKYTTMFNPQPYKVIKITHTRVTTQRDNHVITRNVAHFKKYISKERRDKRSIFSGNESDDDELIQAEAVGDEQADNRNAQEAPRYPRLANREIPYH